MTTKGGDDFKDCGESVFTKDTGDAADGDATKDWMTGATYYADGKVTSSATGDTKTK